jgi:type IV fimbrial biogenesis protein FimT
MATFLSLSQTQRGLTLVETLFCVALSLTLLTLTGVAFTRPLESNRHHSRINELLSTLHLARNQAVLRQTPTIVCTSQDGYECNHQANWEAGWLIFTDPDHNQSCRSVDGFVCEDGGEILLFRPPSPPSHGAIIANRERLPIRFGLNGFSEGSNRTFTLCPQGRAERPEQLILSRTGRVRRESIASSSLCH